MNDERKDCFILSLSQYLFLHNLNKVNWSCVQVWRQTEWMSQWYQPLDPCNEEEGRSGWRMRMFEFLLNLEWFVVPTRAQDSHRIVSRSVSTDASLLLFLFCCFSSAFSSAVSSAVSLLLSIFCKYRIRKKWIRFLHRRPWTKTTGYPKNSIPNEEDQRMIQEDSVLIPPTISVLNRNRRVRATRTHCLFFFFFLILFFFSPEGFVCWCSPLSICFCAWQNLEMEFGVYL